MDVQQLLEFRCSTESIVSSPIDECTHLLTKFIASNFTGGQPRSSDVSTAELAGKFTVDDIEISKCTKDLQLLARAIEIAENCDSENPLFSILRARSYLLHQKCLTERSRTLHDKIFKNYDLFHQSQEFKSLNPCEKTLFLCELVHARLEYREISRAMQILPLATASAGIEPKLFGALGKRTRFQEMLVAQLGVRVDSISENEENGISEGLSIEPGSPAPKNVALNDDTLLNSTFYSENVDDASALLRFAPKQLAFWAAASVRQLSVARDPLLEEELAKYFDLVLRSPPIWLVHRGALLARSRWEKGARRKVERALAQVESVLTEFRTPLDDPGAESGENFIKRVHFAFAAGLEPWWSVEALMATILSSLGCTKEALAVYHRIGDIPNLISCYRSLGRLERAEQIIRDQLAERKTPQMLTYLGDVTDNPQYYEEAWTLSNGRYGQSQKQLGMMYLRREMLKEALEAFSKAVGSLAVSDQPWYNMGYCAMKLERFEDAAKAFRRCVDIDPDSFDAWNNLAAAYTHLKATDKAFYIIQEALKTNFENWKIWDNFLTLAVETRHWSEAMRALHRLLDLGQTKTDGQLLLVMAENCPVDEITGLREVLARITVTRGSSAAWLSYGLVLEKCIQNEPENSGTKIDKMTKAYQRSLAMLLQEDPQWMKHDASIVLVLDKAGELLKKYIEMQPNYPEFGWKQAFASLRMTAKSAMAATRKELEGRAESSKEISDRLVSLELDLVKMMDLVG